PACVTPVVPAPERGDRHTATAETTEHGDALGITGHRRYRRDLAGQGSDDRELLAGEPADLVELVDAHVAQDPATRCPEPGRRRLAVPLPRLDELDLTELAGGDRRLQALQLGHESAPVADLQHDTAGRCDLGGVPG